MLAKQKRRLFSGAYPHRADARPEAYGGAICEAQNLLITKNQSGREGGNHGSHAAVRSLRSAEPEMPRDEQKRMKMSPLRSTVPVTATSKPSP